MPRHRPKNIHERIVETVVPLVAFLVFAAVFSPPFRVVLVVVVGGLVIAFGIWLIVRKRRSFNPPDATGEPVRLVHPWANPSYPLVAAGKAAPLPPQKITAELLSALEWRRFEILVTAYFRKTGYGAGRNRVGADGGVDIMLTRPGEPQPCACVQCKAWKTYKVGVKPVRELLGVMAAEKIPEGYFVTTGEYTSEALDFAQGKPLTLISGRQLLAKLNQLTEADHADILREVTAGDYTTPTCPRCDVKMVERQGSKGPFWGCRSYPRCRQTFNIREEAGEEAGSYAAG